MKDDKTNEIKDITTNNKGEKKEEETFDSKIDSFLYKLNELNDILKKENEELNKKNIKKLKKKKNKKKEFYKNHSKKRVLCFLKKLQRI